MSVPDCGPELPKGSYVLATKYNDGDPGDQWAVGYYIRRLEENGRHLVGGGDPADENGYRYDGFRRVRSGLRPEVGKWLLENAKVFEASPPGTMNLWTMLTDRAFESDDQSG